jgi:hypothetical protein
MEFSGRDDNNVPTALRINARLANVVDLALEKDNELVIIVRMKT